MTCEVSWKMGTHTNPLISCTHEAKYLAFGIGNEGRTVFAVCTNHAKVADLHPNLWDVVPFKKKGKSQCKRKSRKLVPAHSAT